MSAQPRILPKFKRLGIVVQPERGSRDSILNPACARLRDGTLRLYPRMVGPDSISRIGSFRARERADGTLEVEQDGYALEPSAPYEQRSSGSYGCEDPRVTFVSSIDRYVMAYVALGPRGPEVALAISRDGITWERSGLLHFRESDEPFADKDAAFFPEPVSSPNGIESLAFYHRPTLPVSLTQGEAAFRELEDLPPGSREGISIGYVPLDKVRLDVGNLCSVSETHKLELPEASWGSIKVGAGTPPVRVREGWMSVIHGVDALEHPSGSALLRYCAGVIVHDARRIERVVYRSQEPLFVPKVEGEIHGTVGHVVFPTGIDPRGKCDFDIYYGMADYEIGRGRLRFGTR
jgi:beta-1,2-mannobiose phosphorylase / 1,2-beta-oligomannan phosphorylase